MTLDLDLLITNAEIVNADGRVHGHIGITDGRITTLLAQDVDQLPSAARTIDAGGKLVIPGGVDAHCHVEQITGDYKSLDTFRTATTAALHGGTTTIIDFGIPADRGETPIAALRNKLDLIEGARCDVALHGSVLAWDATVPAQLDEMAEIGVRSVKLYTTNRGTTMADEDTILRVMKEMVRLDGLTYLHCEHDAIVVDQTETCANEGLLAIGHLPRSRPELSEDASVREMIAVAEHTGAPVYLVHQTTPAAVRAAAEARARGLRVFSETCPHYLLLDESVYDSDSPEQFACCPPMRPEATVRGLGAEVALGNVHTIASDHSCYDLAQKRERCHDMRRMPHGLPGVETRMPAAYTAVVTRGGLGVERFVELFATAPARINGLRTKGVIAVGYDADLVLFDPTETRRVDGAALHQGSDFSPFGGLDLTGWPSTVVSGGRVVLDEGRFTDPGPVGRFRERSGFSES
ncbi:dihydroorotase [Streptomyces cavernicola]|uniref:Amidohydrolase family protein n=1 Tax=Streptomyces cavernicola TaxID=3043613 RepID=A0ABT6SBP2_9ACTN|nr:amidohydrolase family protein [Streptomyces sp. B-S-A6]MDI3405618.1 amidohydrolase family protein [Streptomyces sp. B-S-A6]